MTPKQQIAGAGGVALVLANFWWSDTRAVVSDGIFAKGGDTAKAHDQLKVLGGELLLVVVLTLVAGVSDAAGTAMVALVVALGVLWAINHFSTTKGATP